MCEARVIFFNRVPLITGHESTVNLSVVGLFVSGAGVLGAVFGEWFQLDHTVLDSINAA